jgi:hypothetical protein
MSSDDTTAIHELTNEVRGMRGDLRDTLTKLFGDATAENSHGRVPRLEIQVDDLEQRVGILEALRQRGAGAWWMILRIAAVVAFSADLLYHIVTIVRH